MKYFRKEGKGGNLPFLKVDSSILIGIHFIKKKVNAFLSNICHPQLEQTRFHLLFCLFFLFNNFFKDCEKMKKIILKMKIKKRTSSLSICPLLSMSMSSNTLRN